MTAHCIFLVMIAGSSEFGKIPATSFTIDTQSVQKVYMHFLFLLTDTVQYRIKEENLNLKWKQR